MSDETERSFRETLSIVLRTMLLSSIQTGEDCLSLCWGLVGRGHLIVYCGVNYRHGVSSFAEFPVVTCRLAVCAYTSKLSSEVSLLHPHLVKSNRGKSWVTFDDVFRNCLQVVKLSRRSRGEAYSSDVNNSESSCISRTLLFNMFINKL